MQNSFNLRRELYLSKNAKDRIILDIDSIDSFTNSLDNRDRCENEDLNIIELKISLDENDNEFHSLIQKIQEIAKKISSSSQDESELTSNLAKAKSIVQRIKQIQSLNVSMKEDIIEQKIELEQSKTLFFFTYKQFYFSLCINLYCFD